MPKDACYFKVKKRYKVFPSAYASGAIAKCRKVGAKNWGNKSKNKRTKVCRPSRRVSKKTPKTWSQMTKAERSKVVRAKKKVGMGRRRASSSNVS